MIATRLTQGLALAALLAAALPASAQNQLSVSAEQCRRLERQKSVAPADVQPGKDHRGRQVAPADLGGSPNFLPKEVRFDIGVDAATFAPGLTARQRQFLGEQGKVGKVTVGLDGKVAINGVAIGNQLDAELEAACRQMRR